MKVAFRLDMKVLSLVCIIAFLAAIPVGFAGEKQVVIVAATDQQQSAGESAADRKSNKLAALQKWASDNIMLAPREIQLRAALAAKLYQQKGNQPFTLSEWQVFDEVTKWCIILGCPQAIPNELLR